MTVYDEYVKNKGPEGGEAAPDAGKSKDASQEPTEETKS